MKNYSFDSDSLYAEKSAKGSRYRYKISSVRYERERLLVLDILNPDGAWEKNDQIIVSESDFKKNYAVVNT